MPTITLIRHGQASFEADDYDALSPRGLAQAQALGRHLARSRRARRDLHVVCGGLRRHRQTADACLAQLDIAGDPAIDAGFDEYDHLQLIARFEPRYADAAAMRADLAAQADPRRAFQRMFAQAGTRWCSGAHDADYDEPWPAFRARCVAAFERLLAALPPRTDALVFTSGGPISVCCQHLLALGTDATLALQYTLYNAGLTRIALGRDGPRLLSLNEHAHLESDPDLLSFR
jgi:broad specificity phosphatase PhoE